MSMHIDEKYVLHIDHKYKNGSEFKTEIELRHSKPKSDKDNKFDDGVINILNAYLEKYNLEDKYYRLLEKRLDIVATAMDIKLLSGAFTAIFELFSEDDLIDFVVSEGYVPPASLPEAFDVTDAAIGKSDYERTYTRDQYLGLVAIAIPLKAVMPLYAKIFESGNLLTEKKRMPLIIHYAYEKTIAEFDVCNRLETYVEGHMNGKDLNNSRKKKETADELNIQVDRLGDFLVADTLVTYMYSVINKNGTGTNLASKSYSRLKKYLGYGISAAIRERPNSAGKDGEEGSTIEIIKAVTSRSIGEIEEYRLAVLNEEYLCVQLDIDLDKFRDVVKNLNVLQDKSIRLQEHTLMLTNWVLTTILPPDAIQYLDLDVVQYVDESIKPNRDGIIRAIAGAYLVAKKVSNEIAMLIASKSTSDVLMSPTIKQIDRSVQQELNTLFIESLQSPVDYVNTVVNDYLRGITVEPLIQEDVMVYGNAVTVSSDIKTDMAKLLIAISGLSC